MQEQERKLWPPAPTEKRFAGITRELLDQQKRLLDEEKITLEQYFANCKTAVWDTLHIFTDRTTISEEDKASVEDMILQIIDELEHHGESIHNGNEETVTTMLEQIERVLKIGETFADKKS
ncbi:MAG: hypothetical protein A2249_00220 [Candidatus Jacksonbacteria bacterium RIFOXYA2_FULL_44_7]|uniref:Uncharacterized protein n=1 Tax=Candidatus Jacksonbacteria bacterium RIFCSPLOWO2_02_FULL_44_20 TaxID=1798460 RepID=A0A1G2A820_9BACT|nr:MAG: hypothetical protein UW39_C0005G0074 [Parcubacteria group bacterium GW2011_GWC2_44_17]KKT49707.1 MAG: hypothetical protein UW40_C0017G0017 [Parcubacteria group bacterium GW2011_GWF2_44_17]OGY70050.1 MAG: hypothetical protein A3E05_02550 [Candidatus Jacksonbacteria bacterium RIFCSPHIGHO2_12_FULL_44_12]OGY72626.1 MAG: hypothetical protein A3H61_03395 [Candidatus Jacksonbacteria bacterium RIFCSPLOWO2_02_FULL_44_20]OGY74018.1 MAG: hypothetical protein A3H07_01665 [Candidatus Jacksonbacteria